jgi:hypothetical protein
MVISGRVPLLLLLGLLPVVLRPAMGTVWLWVTYALLVLVAPFAVVALAAWGFVDNWLRSQPPEPPAVT